MTEQQSDRLDQLLRSIEPLALEVSRLRRAMTWRTVALFAVAGTSLILIGVLGKATLDQHDTTVRLQQVTEQNQRDIAASNRKLCPIVGVSATGPRSTPIGEWLQKQFEDLFVAYGCTPADLSGIPDFPTPTPTRTH